MSSDEGVGMQSYAFNLTRNLLALDTDNEYVVYCRREVPEILRPFRDRAEFRVAPFHRRKVCEQLWLPTRAPFDSLEVFHCICSLPVFAPRGSVLTIHGLSWRLFPEVFTPALRAYWILTAERTMKKAQRLIAISAWTKSLMVERFEIPEERIDVVHHGVDLETFHPVEDGAALDDLRDRYGLAEPFVLFLGARLPVKNLETLIRAFALLRRSPDLAEHRLVIAGGRGWKEGPTFALVSELGLEDRVTFTGFVPESDLAALYSAAEVFVLPSLYEGFGIPVIEAFACGAPVITSNASCLPEVAGDAALLFDPRSVEELAALLERVLRSASLRQELTRKGLERAGEFSWRTTAERTLRVYEKVYRENRSS